MAVGPAPSTPYQYAYDLSANGNGSYNVTFDYGTSGNIQDLAQGPSDNLESIGDIPNDEFIFDSFGNRVFYVASADNGSGLIGEFDNPGSGFYVLFSNTQYPVGAVINSNQQPVAVCYCSGTLIRSANGEVPVEDLRVGDLAVTASGERRLIRWIGHRILDLRSHPKPETVMPVRIRAHAVGTHKPERDLLVSPGHAICLDILGEVLIPASALINGTTITQEQVEEVTYWHVELDSHDILVANGQPAESYLDMGNRAFFAESGVVDLSALPDAGPAARTHADFCRPFHDGGPLVDLVRAQLRRRAEALGWKLEQADTWAGVHLAVGGQIIEPKVRGLAGCFEVPADAQDVWLVSPTSVPRNVSDSLDSRALGLSLKDLRLHDGLSDMKVVRHDDTLLDEGFHAAEPDHRWTAGRARLPDALFTGMEGTVLLRLDLNAPALPRWMASEAIVETHEQKPKGLRLIKAA